MFSSIENLDLIGFVVHEITFSLDALMIKHQRVWVSAKVSQQCSIDYMESWIKYGFFFLLCMMLMMFQVQRHSLA